MLLKLNNSRCYHHPLLKWVCLIFKLEIFLIDISKKIAFWDFTDVLFLNCACFLLTDFGVDIVWNFQVCFACDLCVFIFQGRIILNILIGNSVNDVKWTVTIQSLITLALPASDTDLFNQGSLRLSKKMLNILRLLKHKNTE